MESGELREDRTEEEIGVGSVGASHRGSPGSTGMRGFLGVGGSDCSPRLDTPAESPQSRRPRKLDIELLMRAEADGLAGPIEALAGVSLCTLAPSRRAMALIRASVELCGSWTSIWPSRHSNCHAESHRWPVQTRASSPRPPLAGASASSLGDGTRKSTASATRPCHSVRRMASPDSSSGLDRRAMKT